MKNSNLLITHTHRNPSSPILILAHGAGSPMDSDWMNELTLLLDQKGIRVARFEFPYMARRRKEGVRSPPDPLPILLNSWRSVIESLKNQSSSIFIGGKSMGGRIATMVANEFDILGLICLGYPLHPPGKVINNKRIQCLQEVSRPTLILQGERDSMGSFDKLSTSHLSPTVQTKCIPSGDHSFKPLKKSGITLKQNLELAAETIVSFIKRHL